uniref:transposase n=1 Tax=Candidatus Enterovibrio escicola TaxID=1927127 RepID=UPI000BE24A10|nr:transposase [Candidatus Enterovibrio escacola]
MFLSDSLPSRTYGHRRVAKRGQGTRGWFYSFKLHLIINDQDDIILVMVTTTNIGDGKLMLDMTNNLLESLY